MVIVSGFEKDIPYQQECTRCICDNTIPGIAFDGAGVCSLCHLHDKLDKTYPNDARGAEALEKKFARIKADGKNKKAATASSASAAGDSIHLLAWPLPVGNCVRPPYTSTTGSTTPWPAKTC